MDDSYKYLLLPPHFDSLSTSLYKSLLISPPSLYISLLLPTHFTYSCRHLSTKPTDMSNIRTPPPVPDTPAAVGIEPGAVEVDEEVWRAVAGVGVDIAGENSRVYYFLQGHLEHLDASSPAKNHNFPQMPSKILCLVTSVHLHSDRVSEQPFVKYILQPTDNQPVIGGGTGGGGAADNDLVCFEKVVGVSESYSSGGSQITLPMTGAEAVFPILDRKKVPAHQNLAMTDTLNVLWDFKHTYRDCHRLTSGWARYRDLRKPDVGDCVVFMRRKSTNDLLIGVRRSRKFDGSGEGYGGQEFVNEIEKAARGMEFEVRYYPKIGVPSFVVLAEKVDQSLQRQWKAGMRIRMKDDSNTIQGIVHADLPDSGDWIGLAWRVLNVRVDGTVKLVSPWEVEVEDIPVPPADFRASKRPRLTGMTTTDDVPVNDPSLSSSFLPPTDTDLSLSLSLPSLPPTDFSDPTLTSELLNYYSSPAGMASTSSANVDDPQEPVEDMPPSDGQPTC